LLTNDDGRNDGRFRGYLKKRSRWRRFDEKLFDSLSSLIGTDIQRSVELAESWNLIPGARYFRDSLTDESSQRESYFNKVWKELPPSSLLFFDPDKGIEIPSVVAGKRESRMYIYRKEIKTAYESRHSLLIYQHFRQRSSHEERDALIKRRAEELRKLLPASQVDSFKAKNVVYFLVSRPEHVSRFSVLRERIAQRWAGQIVHIPGGRSTLT
jgi:hypothetical protein